MDKKKCNTYSQTLEALLAAALFVLLIYYITGYNSLVVVAGALMACGLISKKGALRIGRSWLLIANFIGRVNNYVLLTVIFYCVLTPLAVVYRIFHPKLLQLCKEPKVTTYFIKSNQVITSQRFEKPW